MSLTSWGLILKRTDMGSVGLSFESSSVQSGELLRVCVLGKLNLGAAVERAANGSEGWLI